MIAWIVDKGKRFVDYFCALFDLKAALAVGTLRGARARKICLGVAGNLREAVQWRGAPAEGGAQ